MKRRVCQQIAIRGLILALMVLVGIAQGQTNAAFPGAAAGLSLAQDLAGDGRHAEAALEYRRLALSTTNSQARGGLFWAAAYEYAFARQWSLVPSLLDRAEDNDGELQPVALLLRAEAASAGEQHVEAVYYLESIPREKTSPEMHKFITRRIAGEHLRQGKTSQARAELNKAPDNETPAALTVLANYEEGRDKSPTLGGVLGLIPGLGYVYAGEYASGLRSLILNGLFAGAMVYSGVEDQWGAFAALTFFEVTWYSGSIYGGIDAAKNYNRLRRESCLQAIEGRSAFAPDFKQLPVIFLQFRF